MNGEIEAQVDAAVGRLRALMAEMREKIIEVYLENEFAILMFDTQPDFDYAGLSEKLIFRQKVQETLAWKIRIGGPTLLLGFARLVSKRRPLREDLKAIVDRFEAFIAPPAPVPDGENRLAELLSIDLQASLAVNEEAPFALAVELRPKLRAAPIGPFDLPGKFHLSDSEGRRLVAILALEATPSKTYLRWLAERVVVETPFLSFVASQALIAAALKLDREDLKTVKDAIAIAGERLDSLVDPDEVVPGYDIASCKVQLQLAQALVEMRTKKTMPSLKPENFDQLIRALVAALTPLNLDDFFKTRLDIKLSVIAGVGAPPELRLASALISSRNNGWLGDLVRAAGEEQPGNNVFIQAAASLGPAPIPR